MSQPLNRVLMFTMAAAISTSVFSQQPTPSRTDSTRRPNLPAAASQGPKAYKDVITDKAKTDEGMFKVHRIDDKYFFEIPDSLLGREILVVNRITKAGAGMRNGFFGYAGDQIGQNVIR